MMVRMLPRDCYLITAIFNHCAMTNWCATNGLRVCVGIGGNGDVSPIQWQHSVPCPRTDGVPSKHLAHVLWDEKSENHHFSSRLAMAVFLDLVEHLNGFAIQPLMSIALPNTYILHISNFFVISFPITLLAYSSVWQCLGANMWGTVDGILEDWFQISLQPWFHSAALKESKQSLRVDWRFII